MTLENTKYLLGNISTYLADFENSQKITLISTAECLFTQFTKDPLRIYNTWTETKKGESPDKEWKRYISYIYSLPFWPSKLIISL